ncbi:MAG TPA: DNA-formamidopyrimidine glycosylase family protein [Bacillota bacterium]|nr:DNA-formamidopyrimidine glycosylase family protein [Bacillota bacterium]
MPELPEIYNLSSQMHSALVSRKITDAEVRQEKCLNLPTPEFTALVTGKTISSVTSKGKWVIAKLDPGAYFLLSLGMGGNVILHKPGALPPEKYQLKLDLDDHSCLSISFWWFGYAHAVPADKLSEHRMTASLGLTPLRDSAFTMEYFLQLLQGKKGGIKSFLMNQANIAGIGNVYIQDILFKAGLHPNRKTPEISIAERKLLYQAIIDHLTESINLGGLAFENDLYGQPGRFRNFLVGYREKQPCPKCGTMIIKLKTGSTASYICSECQK